MKWSYGPSCPVDFPLDIFIYSYSYHSSVSIVVLLCFANPHCCHGFLDPRSNCYCLTALSKMCDECVCCKSKSSLLHFCPVVRFCSSFVARHYDVKPRLSEFRTASVGRVDLEVSLSASVQR